MKSPAQPLPGNVWLFALCNTFGFAVTPMMMFIGSLIGAELAPSIDLATLPIAIMVMGTATGTLPVALLMKRIGSRYTHLVYAALGVVSCLFTGQALAMNSFSLFLLGAYAIGFTNAAIQQLRFTAMESVPLERAPVAASTVLCGGIFAAILGPELAVRGQLLTETAYQGSCWLAAGCFVITGLLISQLKASRHHQTAITSAPRKLSVMLKNPSFILAITSACVGFMVMTFVMTATPISMHHHDGHSLLDTKWVVQSHISAMYLPSLISPLLFRWIGIRGMMIAGLLAYCVTLITGYIDNSVTGYWIQLVMLGIGWNFLFVAGTVLLPSTYQKGEQFKAQAFNDGFVFSFQALASLSAGWVISQAGWQSVLMSCLGPMTILVLVLLWSQRKTLLGRH